MLFIPNSKSTVLSGHVWHQKKGLLLLLYKIYVLDAEIHYFPLCVLLIKNCIISQKYRIVITVRIVITFFFDSKNLCNKNFGNTLRLRMVIWISNWKVQSYGVIFYALNKIVRSHGFKLNSCILFWIQIKS